MTISEKIFELLEKRGMSQKEFSDKTGIAQSAVSDWKRKKTNPVSDKILIICEVLDVTPEELLSGTEQSGGRSRKQDYYIIGKDTELGLLVESYRNLAPEMRARLEGYMEALKAMEEH
ncbi:MAG: helix-turn-helix domain-containing protein [Lachnospiraceae bacterium]|nr:helix-turn-helix domain-containing protein [Lachnospiraceae bacterium]